MKKITLLIASLLLTQISISQNYKFGKVSIEELKEKVYPLDSTANAAYLLKKRRTYTVVNGGNIQLITDVQVRLKIYNQDGFDYGTKSIYLFGSKGSKNESLSSLKAVTYNLVDGEIVEAKLSKKDVFLEKSSDNYTTRKFTMPNLKEGSIVEWSYKIYSPFYTNINDVKIQYDIPVKKYEAKIELLEWFKFSKRSKGHYSFNIKESSKSNSDFNTNDKVILISEQNIPALIEEPYVNNIDNYKAGLVFEIVALSAPDLLLFEDYSTSWGKIAKKMNASDAFGGEIKKTSHLKDDIAKIENENPTLNSKIVLGLQLVKSKIKWNGNLGEYPENGIRNAYKEGVGNIGDINLTLVAVLRELGLNASPVLVSTRSHGIPFFPTRDGINYVVAAVHIGNKSILLDASEKYSLPDLLPLRAINWRGIAVKKDGSFSFVKLGTSIKSKEESTLTYKILEDGFIEGMNRVKYENLSSVNYRNNKGGLSEENLISKIESSNGDIEIINFRLSNKENISKPISETYTFEKEDGVDVIGNKMYLTPMLFGANTENPFKLDNRLYPIDFGTPWSDKMSVNIKIPEGYKVEFLPESIGYEMSNNLGKFIYSIKENQGKLTIVSIVEINEGIIMSSKYHELKDFFRNIVKKQTEKVVLSKG